LTGGLRIEALIVLLLLAVTSIDSFRKKRDEVSGFAPYVAIYFMTLILSVVISWDPSRSWYIFFNRVLKYSMMGLFISRFVKSPKHLYFFVAAWILACFKITLEGFHGGITGSMMWENQGIMRLHGNGLYRHPNSLSQLALGVFPFVFYLYPIAKKWVMKILLLVLLFFSGFCVLYAGSRTGYLGIIMFSFFVFLKSPKFLKKRIIIVAMLLVPIIALYTPQQYRDRFKSTFIGKEEEGQSKEGRKRQYFEGIEVLSKHPFGVGVGNYTLANRKYYGSAQEIHCLYLQVATHIGIQGLIAFGFLLYKLYSVLTNVRARAIKIIDTLSNEMKTKEKIDIEFVLAVINSALIYFLLRLFVDIFSMDLYGICWWFLIGIASSTQYIITKYEKK
jgi:O-antigen ligase